MPHQASDALVFFGATGDLAYKKIFPSLHNMVKRDMLDVPVIGVAKSGWTLEQLRERAKDSIAKHGGGVDDEAFQKLCELLHYIDGDYKDDKTYQELRRKLGDAQLPTHYLAIPPSMFPVVVQGLAKSGCAKKRASLWRSRLAATWFGAQAERNLHRFSRREHLSASIITWARKRWRTC